MNDFSSWTFGRVLFCVFCFFGLKMKLRVWKVRVVTQLVSYFFYFSELNEGLSTIVNNCNTHIKMKIGYLGEGGDISCQESTSLKQPNLQLALQNKVLSCFATL
jgi:hypothetical protein